MKKIKLYIAVSLDGYIATPDGGIEWLNEITNPTDEDHSYNALLASVDTVLMGGRTYHEIIGFGVPWPYKDKQTYVISRNNTNVTPDERVEFITENIYAEIATLKTQDGKDIWLVGGGKLTTMLLNHELIDEMQIAIVPIVLGAGLPLFPNNPLKSKWTLKESKSYDTGLVVSTYEKI
ncbi:Dihydrofolate reductase [Mucinivorans hirudinis]|uniref:Dihydrofolate reductase n=1 Tax=Mucinivorans hirudinis TaxID=1433126 RepID=A0A060R6E3_9BACT|nr:Dihydrofolate reductase [Mucinivorans hirudinis]